MKRPNKGHKIPVGKFFEVCRVVGSTKSLMLPDWKSINVYSLDTKGTVRHALRLEEPEGKKFAYHWVPIQWRMSPVEFKEKYGPIGKLIERRPHKVCKARR